jgi:hypothetical protein
MPAFISEPFISVTCRPGNESVLARERTDHWPGCRYRQTPPFGRTPPPLAMRFRVLLMGSSMEKLDVWLQDARLSGVYGALPRLKCC